MPKSITLNQLNQYRTQLTTGQLSVTAFYDMLSPRSSD